MGMNLNISKKPENELMGKLIHENINTFGLQFLWLDSTRVNEDNLVFKDFSHFKLDKTSGFETVILKPEVAEMWEGDTGFGSFGIFQQQTANLFISKIDLLRLYPDFYSETGSRGNVVNSLIISPGGSILEITNVEGYHEGISNLFGYADNPNSYKLTARLYSPNLSDEGVSEINDTVSLSEGPDGEIFDYDENVDTSAIDEFFDGLLDEKEEIDNEAQKTSKPGGIFGNLS